MNGEETKPKETSQNGEATAAPCSSHFSLAGQQIIDGLPDYDRFIIEAITETLRKWIDKQRHGVVWLHKNDIDQLETWAKDLATQYRDAELQAAAMDAETLQQPNEGWTPAEPWPHRAV